MQKRSTFEINPLTLGLFCALSRSVLKHGITICSQQASGPVERLSPVGSAQISLSLSKSVASKQSIPPDTCVQESTRAKPQTSLSHQLLVQHPCRALRLLRGQLESAKFTCMCAALNPLANTIFPESFERTASNIQSLQRYMQSYPIRLHRNGYTIDPILINICKQHSRSRRAASSSQTA